MNVVTAITIGISIAGFIGGIVIKVADVSLKLGRLTQQVEQNEKRDTEERGHASAKFSELYNRTADHSASISSLSVSIKSLTEATSRIENKLDRLIEKERAE